MNQEQINKDLRDKDSTTSDFQRHLVNIYRSFMCESSSTMSQFWYLWDKDYLRYTGYRSLDKKDVQNLKKGGTAKIIVPLSFATVQTAAANSMQMFMNKERLFELTAYGPEDEDVREGLERDIDYQIKHNRIYHTLYLQLIDAFTKGITVGRCDWETQKKKYRVKEKRPIINPIGQLLNMFGMGQPSSAQYEEVETVKELIQYEGNVISYISPYSFFPDPSVPLRDFQNGSYCAVEQCTTKVKLLEQEGTLFHGVNRVPNSIPENIYRGRQRYAGTFRVRKDQTGLNYVNSVLGDKVSTGTQMDTVEMFLKLVPKEITEKYGIDIGNEEEPIMFVLVVANDTKVIRFERYEELHGKFPFFVSQPLPDGDSFIGLTLPGVLDGLQQMITWLINSHMQNIRQAIKNRFLIKTKNVNMDDVVNNADFIRVEGSTSLGDAIIPLTVSDMTANHVPFVQTLQQIAQMATGITENAMGMYTSGRRSALQTRGVQAAAQARLALMVNNMWYGGLDILGELILSNTRQFRTQEVYEQIIGDAIAYYPYDRVIMSDPAKIAGGYDFVPIEPITDGGRMQIASLAKELLSNPNLIQATNLSVDKILSKIFEIMGIRNYEAYKNAPQPQQPAPAPQINVVPDEQAMMQAQQGNIAPTGQEAMPIAQALQNGQL